MNTPFSFHVFSASFSLLPPLQAYNRSFKDVDLVGTFVDNHDNVRFLNMQSDTVLYRNALTYVLLSPGIPIVYYGSEQVRISGGLESHFSIIFNF